MDAKFSSILHKKSYCFLFYTPIFTKYPHQFINLHIYSIKYSFFYNFISCLVGEKVVEKSRKKRKDDRQPKICWFSLCLVNFLYFLFSLCFSWQLNKSRVILISCFTWFWKKFFDVVFFVDAWCGILWWSAIVKVSWEWEQPKR